jgi:hypothetical protein
MRGRARLACIVSGLALALTMVFGLLPNSSIRALATQGAQGCWPQRADDFEHHRWDGWTHYAGGLAITGAQGYISTYSPWVSAPNVNQRNVSAWSMLQLNNDPNHFAQIGWLEYYGNVGNPDGTGTQRWTFTEVSGGLPRVINHPVINSSHYYTVEYQTSNDSVQLLEDSVTEASQTLGWGSQPSEADVLAETQGLGDQMPGDTLTPATLYRSQFYDTESVDPGASYPWHRMNFSGGAVSVYGDYGGPPNYSNPSDVHNAVGQFGQSAGPDPLQDLNVWDRYCPYSDSRPGISYNPAGGQQDVFWKGPSGDLWESWLAPNNPWNGPADLTAQWPSAWPAGSALASAPAAADTTGQQLVFWQGTNGHLWEAWYSNGWNGPSDLTATWGNSGAPSSSPSVAVDSSGTQLVYWRGPGSHLWEAWFTGRWNGPSDISAAKSWPTSTNLNGPPAVSTPTGQQTVYWYGTNGHIWEAFYASGVWYPPGDLTASAWRYGGIPASDPSAAVTPDGTQLVFWQGPSSHVWEAWYTGVWNGPADISAAWSSGKTVLGAPSVMTGGGQQILFYRGPDYHVWNAYFTSIWNGAYDRGWTP